MEQIHHGSSRSTERCRRSEFLVEREKFRKTMREIQATTEKRAVILHELERLYREHACSQWDIRYLEQKINQMAKRLDLEPLPTKQAK